MRNPRVKSSIARYMGEFVADKTDGGFIKGTQWLVWKFESDSTLSDAMQVCCLHCLQFGSLPVGSTLLCDSHSASCLHHQLAFVCCHFTSEQAWCMLMHIKFENIKSA